MSLLKSDRPTRDRRWWLGEGVAGLAGGIASVPDGMATAVLAGASPMAGLYASIAGPIVGGALSSTSVMVVAATSAAAATTSQAMAAPTSDRIATLATLTALAGLFMLVATRLGFHRLIRFVSASVMGGFLFGIGLVIVLGQLADATGVTTSGATVAEKAWNTVVQWQSFDVASVATAAAAIALTAVLGRGRWAAAGPLLAIVVPTVVLRLTGTRVTTVGDTGTIATGLPPLVLPDPGLITPELVSTAVALTIVILVQAAGVGSAYPNTDGPNEPRRDLYAQGAANVASALVGGIPVGGSVGQTAVNVLAGARSRWASILSGVWMLVFVVALGPVLSAIPLPALAGLLILAGVRSLQPLRLLQSWRTSRASGAAAVLTLIATLVAPIHLAVLAGVLLSLLLVGLQASSDVRVTGLVKAADGTWLRVEPAPTALPGEVTVVDVEGPGDFGAVTDLFAGLPAPDPAGGGAVVLRMRGFVQVNLTGFLALRRYGRTHRTAGGQVYVCGLRSRAIRRLRALGMGEDVVLVPESDHVNGSLEDAVAVAGLRFEPEAPATT